MLNRIKNKIIDEGMFMVCRISFIYLSSTLAAYEGESHNISGLPRYDENNNTNYATSAANVGEGVCIGLLLGICVNAVQLFIAVNLSKSSEEQSLLSPNNNATSQNALCSNYLHGLSTSLGTLFCSKKEKVNTVEEPYPPATDLNLHL